MKRGPPYETAKKGYCCHDLGAGGETALKSALAIANRCGAALRLVHVVEPLGRALSRQYKRADPAQGPGARHDSEEVPERRSQNLFSPHGFSPVAPEKPLRRR